MFLPGLGLGSHRVERFGETRAKKGGLGNTLSLQSEGRIVLGGLGTVLGNLTHARSHPVWNLIVCHFAQISKLLLPRYF